MDERLVELRRKRAAGEHLAAIDLAQVILREPEMLTVRDLFEAARIGAGAAMAIGECHLARKLTGRELLHAESTGDADLMAIAAFHVGTVDMYMGETEEALLQFAEFAAADTPPRPALDPFRGACWLNAGTVHMTRRNNDAAVNAFIVAREHYAAQANHAGVIRTLLQEAWALLTTGRHESAGHRLEQAIAALAEFPDDGLQATCLCHRAYYHQQLGEHALAMTLCQEVSTPGRPGVTPHHLSEACWITGECALALGRTGEAESLAIAASNHAVAAQWPSLMNRATDLLRRIREAGGQTA